MKYVIDAKQGNEYDVIVCGAGTSGVAAAISAGRQGAKVLLVERSFHVGGMLTEGNAGITKFTDHCKDREQYKREVLDKLATEPRSVQVAGGLAHEICMKLISIGGGAGTDGDCGSYVFSERYAFENMLIEMLQEADVEILYDSRVCFVDMDGDALKKIVVANKDGFTEFSAKCFIDCTGDADVAALSGVEWYYGSNEKDVIECDGKIGIGNAQPMGVMYRVEGIDFEALFKYLENNPGFCIQSCALMDFEDIKESFRKGDMCCFNLLATNPDPESAKVYPQTCIQVYVSPSRTGAILLSYGPTHNCFSGNGLDAKTLSTAQNLMVSGALEITEILRREYPQGFKNAKVTHVPDIGVRETRHILGKYVMTAKDIVTGREFENSIGCGGHHIDCNVSSEEVKNMKMHHWRFHMPYQIMVPEKVKNLLVAGRAVSATKLASGTLRVTVCCMEMGEAAGVASVLCAQNGLSPDEVDVKEVQRILLENGAVL